MIARRAASLTRALPAALLLAAAGCAGPAFERAPRSPVDLSGHWLIDPAASDDASAIITAALPKRRAREFDTVPVQAGGAPGGSGGDQRRSRGQAQSAVPPPTPPPWGRGSAGDFVRAFAMPAARLDVAAQPALITVAQGDRRRSFQPGDDEPLSVTDRFGSRTVRAGWDGNVFTVQSTDGSRLRVVERFERLPNDRLGTMLEFNAIGMKTIKVHSAYRRATEAELSGTLPDGPPSPGPR